MYFRHKKAFLGLTIVILVVTFVTLKENDCEQDLLKRAYESVKMSYGEFYIPSIRIEPTTLKELYGISLESVESYFGESAMMTTYPDVFIGVKVKKGHVKSVTDALNAYKEDLLIRFQESPSGLAKVKASRVFVYEAYVFYMVLGQPSDTMITSEEITAHVARAEEAAAIGIEKLQLIFDGQ